MPATSPLVIADADVRVPRPRPVSAPARARIRLHRRTDSATRLPSSCAVAAALAIAISATATSGDPAFGVACLTLPTGDADAARPVDPTRAPDDAAGTRDAAQPSAVASIPP